MILTSAGMVTCCVVTGPAALVSGRCNIQHQYQLHQQQTNVNTILLSSISHVQNALAVQVLGQPTMVKQSQNFTM